jgi:hypothetical protein
MQAQDKNGFIILYIGSFSPGLVIVAHDVKKLNAADSNLQSI